MVLTETQTGVAALLDACAQQRSGEVLASYADDTARIARTAQAEAAGRELLAALVRPDPWPDLSLGARLRRMVGYLQTVISASVAETEMPPLFTVHAQHVVVDMEGGRLLCNAALCLILAAYDDGAEHVDLVIEAMASGARLVVESSRPAITHNHPALIGLRQHIATIGGTWHDGCSSHGQSWIVAISVPFTETPAEDQ